mgnify:CR=1 FL=1
MPTTIPDNLAKCDVDNKQMLKRKENFEVLRTVLEQDLQKTGKGFTVIKNSIQDKLTGISQ